jgi:hypothetical protein
MLATPVRAASRRGWFSGNWNHPEKKAPERENHGSIRHAPAPGDESPVILRQAWPYARIFTVRSGGEGFSR